MNASLVASCLWVLAATITALLPMRLQYPPGFMLLILAPVLIVWLGLDYGVWIALLAFVGFLSMFRNPLTYLGRKALGLPVRRPGEGRTE